MGQTVKVDSYKQALAMVRRDVKRKRKRIDVALRKTARQGKAYVRRNVPVAFGELRNGITSDKTRIYSTAPHAAPVETGSRPHWPPLEPLVRWVKLRGMQALTGRGGRGPSKRLPGTTTRGAATAVGSMLGGGGASFTQLSADIDAPTQVARMIQRAIAKRGTRPHWFMRKSIPEVRRLLAINLEVAMKQDRGASSSSGPGGE